jgi:hypothetical protein
VDYTRIKKPRGKALKKNKNNPCVFLIRVETAFLDLHGKQDTKLSANHQD